MDLIESRSCAARLASLLRDEQHALADFLLALADFDRRRGWFELGYSGLFPFLHRQLGLSKAASYYRLTAAGLLQRFPDIIEPLRDGRLCLLWNDRSTAPNVCSFRPDQTTLEMAQLDG